MTTAVHYPDPCIRDFSQLYRLKRSLETSKTGIKNLGFVRRLEDLEVCTVQMCSELYHDATVFPSSSIKYCVLAR